MTEELQNAINQYYEHAQFYLKDEDRHAIELIIEKLEETLKK